MWVITVYKEIARRTGESPEEVKRLLSLFFGRHGIRKVLKNKDEAQIRNFMTIRYSGRALYRQRMKEEKKKRDHIKAVRKARRKYERKRYRLQKKMKSR